MTKLFYENREKLINLIYEMNEFTLTEIEERFNFQGGLIGDCLIVREFITSLCVAGLLKNNGFTFKVIPEDQQISNMIFDFYSIK
jgi:hypothetical protein